MADKPLGPGEQAARKRSRFLMTIIVVCGVIGGALGAILARSDPNGIAMIDIARLSIPPLTAIVLALGFVIALVGAPLYMFAKVDEMKVQRNLKSMTGGCLAVLGLYPAWQMLAAGGLAMQPSAPGVFVLCYVVTVATFLLLLLRR